MTQVIPTIRYLTTVEPLKDAEHELDRAEEADDDALLAWAKKWGRPCVVALRELQEQVENSQDWGVDE